MSREVLDGLGLQRRASVNPKSVSVAVSAANRASDRLIELHDARVQICSDMPRFDVRFRSLWPRMIAGTARATAKLFGLPQPLLMIPSAYDSDFSWIEWTTAAKDFSQRLLEVQTFPGAYEPDTFEINQARDVYGTPVNGVSLADIEKLSRPLNNEGIATVNNFFCIGLINKLTPIQLLAQEIGRLLPTEVAVVNDDGKIPFSVRPLAYRLRDYFDYWTGFVTANYLEPEQEDQFIQSGLWVGYGSHFLALGGYIPARLGITPSSAINLFLRRERVAEYESTMKDISDIMTASARHAYPKLDRGSQLSRYMEYNPENDARVSETLLERYTGLRPIDNQGLMDQLDPYQRSIRRDFVTSGTKMITLDCEPNFFGERIIIFGRAAGGLVSTVLMRDGKSHLSLEFGSGDDIYGIPAEVFKHNPHADQIIQKDVVGAMLVGLHKKYPDAVSAPVESRPINIQTPTVVAELPPEKIKSLYKIRTRRERLAGKLGLSASAAQPAVAEPVVQRPRSCVIMVDPVDVRKQMGKKVSDKELLRVMNGFTRVEYGHSLLEPIEHAAGLYKFRVGGRRIIVRALGSNNYEFQSVGSRGQIYKEV